MQQCMTDGFKPTLAIVFISVTQNRDAVCKILQKENIDILGATSCGEFIDGYQGKGSAAILLMDLPREAYTILFEEIGDKSIRTLAESMAITASQKFSKPAFIICSTAISPGGDYFDGEALVSSIEKVIGPHTKIVGGMAGDDGHFTGTFVFTNNQVGNKAIAILVLDEDRITVHGKAISGWKPLGITRTATRSEDGWLYSIDGNPALDMYLKYLGMNASDVHGKQNIFEDISFHYPFLSIDAGDPQIRTPLLVDSEKNAIKLDFPLPEGTRLQFTMPPDFDIVETVLDGARELKKDTEAEALLIFSCAGRHSTLGPMVNSENEGLHQIWNAPMAGFFTYGEYGNGAQGRPQFHSTTCSWVALKEK